MKVLIEKLVTEFVYGGHLLSFGAMGVILTIVQLLELPFNIVVILIPYLSTQVIYSYNHVRELGFDTKSNPERVSHISSRRRLTEFLLLSYIVSLGICLLMTNLPTIIFVVSIITSGITYTDYFKGKVARFITGSKNFYSAFFWALQIFIVPLFYKSGLTAFYGYFFCIIFLTAFVNSTFFDIKDIISDKERGLKTFPVLWGVRKTVYFLYVLKLSTLVPLIIGVYSNAMPKETLVFLFFVVYGLYYLTKAQVVKGKKLRNLSYIIADGEYILWPLLTFITIIIFELLQK